MKNIKLTFALNVWNTYEDTLLAFEILKLQNNEKKIFSSINCITMGGYHILPNKIEGTYSKHYFVDTPQVAKGRHHRFLGLYRILEGIKLAYHEAEKNGDDFVIVTNADAWVLDIDKIQKILSNETMQNAAIGCRVGVLTGLALNMGNKLPQIDDHFLILNVNQCKQDNVFDYDQSVKFYHSRFDEIGGIHNILNQFFSTRLQANKLYVYSNLDSAISQYGDCSGWSLLPWQYEVDTGFLHANCAQMNELHYLRAELMRHLKFDSFPNVKKYCDRFPKNQAPYSMTIRHGVTVRRRTARRWFSDHGFFLAQRSGWVLRKLFIYSIKQSAEQEKWFWKNLKIYPNNLLG